MEDVVICRFEPVLPNADFWRGKRVLVTGHTGFKGSWLALWLAKMGAEVSGIALEPETEPSLFTLAKLDQLITSHIGDITDSAFLAACVAEANPQIILHLAAQSLVLRSYEQPLESCSTNVMGTANLLDAMRSLSELRAAVMVTTDKVYENHEQGRAFTEGDSLGGKDLYSASKAASELIVSAYRESFLQEQGVAVATARAGNVIGGGDWAENRLIPDAVRCWGNKEVLGIRMPNAVRPWQHVLEPLAGYLVLAEQLWEKPALAGAWNFGPATQSHASVRDLVALAQEAYGSGEVHFHDDHAGPHEATLLQLDNSKAQNQLGVLPRWGLAESVTRTMAWYRAVADGADARALCEADIAAFMEVV